MRKQLIFNRTLLCLLIGVSSVVCAEETIATERRKSINKVYPVDNGDQLFIDNQYGHVKVSLWDKKEIRVDIVVTANSGSEQDADDYLNSVQIAESRDKNQIRLVTQINRKNVGGGAWAALKNITGGKNTVRIDYAITMPKNNVLSIHNKFGDTHIPSFSAPLSVDVRYGNFYANELENVRNTIDVAYGNAVIGKIEEGKMYVRYSNLRLDKARSLLLVNKFGKVDIGQVDVITADIDYSGARIRKLQESCKINLNFSGGFTIAELPVSVNSVDVNASYSSVELPVESGHFNVSVSYGDFNYPREGKVTFLSQPDSGGKPLHTKKYEGKVGGGGTRVNVVSRYGNVNFRN